MPLTDYGALHPGDTIVTPNDLVRTVVGFVDNPDSERPDSIGVVLDDETTLYGRLSTPVWRCLVGPADIFYRWDAIVPTKDCQHCRGSGIAPSDGNTECGFCFCTAPDT
jgi:hypothetical protein